MATPNSYLEYKRAQFQKQMRSKHIPAGTDYMNWRICVHNYKTQAYSYYKMDTIYLPCLDVCAPCKAIRHCLLLYDITYHHLEHAHRPWKCFQVAMQND